MTRNFVQGMKKEDDGPCVDCTEEYLCEYHDPDGEFHEHTNPSEEEIDALARVMKNWRSTAAVSTWTRRTA